MLSLATFGAGFATRPIGAWVLGGYADRVGRRPAMVLSFALMGGAVALLALTPSYAAIGLAAPVIAVAARLIQGFALGGEIGSNTAFLLEAAPPDRRARMVAWQVVSQLGAATVGSTVALALSATMPAAALETWGWRIALLLGVTVLPAGFWLRRTLPETLEAPETPAAGAPAPFGRIAALGLAIIAGGTIGNYIFQYMATFGQEVLHLSAGISFAAEAANNLSGLVATFVGAWWADRFGRRGAMLWPSAVFLALIFPCFWWMTRAPGAASLVIANIVLSASTGIAWGSAMTSIAENLPKAARSRSFAMIYSVAVAGFGGTTQLVATALINWTGSSFAPAWYLFVATAVGLVAMAWIPETAPAALARRRPVLQPAVA